MTTETLNTLDNTEAFVTRHNGPRESDIQVMLETLGYPSLDALMDAVVPDAIRLRTQLDLPAARTEDEVLQDFRAMAVKNKVFRSYIGMGYSTRITPPVILRNILENPGWYTAYTPYQAEISQGRLEALAQLPDCHRRPDRPADAPTRHSSTRARPSPRRCT